MKEKTFLPGPASRRRRRRELNQHHGLSIDSRGRVEGTETTDGSTATARKLYSYTSNSQLLEWKAVSWKHVRSVQKSINSIMKLERQTLNCTVLWNANGTRVKQLVACAASRRIGPPASASSSMGSPASRRTRSSASISAAFPASRERALPRPCQSKRLCVKYCDVLLCEAYFPLHNGLNCP